MIDFFITNKKAFFDVLSIWILAVMMPGPDMFLVIRSAIKKNKLYALSAGYGIVAGTLVWLIVGFFLIGILSKTSFFQWVQLCGGAYLLYMTYKIFISLFEKGVQNLDESENFAPQESRTKAFWCGVMTNLSNPKAPVFISAVLTKLPQNMTVEINILWLFVMLAIPSIWFPLVARFFSIKKVFSLFLRYSKVLDGVAVCIFGIVGVELFYQAFIEIFR